MSKQSPIAPLAIFLLFLYSLTTFATTNDPTSNNNNINNNNPDLFKTHYFMDNRGRRASSFVRIGKSHLIPDHLIPSGWSNFIGGRGYDVMREQPMGASRGLVNLYRQANNIKRRPGGTYDSKKMSSFVRLGKRFAPEEDVGSDDDVDDVVKSIFIGGHEPDVYYEPLPIRQ